MVDILNGGSLAMMLSIGHRTGLFDTMAPLGAVTSQQLADAAELNERYVREWLAAMTMGGIVDYDAEAKTYTLPVEHQLLVTRAGGPMNLSSMMQYVSLMGQVETDVVEAFRTGDGVPYSKYPDFQRLMAEDSAALFDAALLTETLPAIPGIVERLEAGIDVADIGCGSGHALVLMAGAFPNSRFTGFDFSDEGLRVARKAANGLNNLAFTAVDAAALDEPERFDFITTFDAIHDQAQPALVLENIHAALRPDGTYLCVEPQSATALEDNMDEPVAAFRYTISTMHCMSVSIAGGGEGLGTCWGTELTTEYLVAAGFDDVSHHLVPTDRSNTHFVCQKS